MSAPIRSQVEIQTIINKGQNSLADLGYTNVGNAKIGEDLTDPDFNAEVYRLILLRAYLKNILDSNTGELKLFYTVDANQVALNILLDAIEQLSGFASGGAIPLSVGRRSQGIVFYPSTSGPSTGGQSQSGGAAAPGGVTFQNLAVSAPGEVVDILDASASDYAFYIISVRGSGVGEGSRLDIIGAQWRNSETPAITEYRGADVGGSTSGVTFSAELNDGNIELTANVPTDGWTIKGTRISFENISFQNAQGPLPTGGVLGNFLRKSSSTPYDAAWADIAISEIVGLATALSNLQANIDSEVAALENSKVSKSGDTMSGDLFMNNYRVTGLAAPSDTGDAATKAYVDSSVSPEFTDDGIAYNTNFSGTANFGFRKVGSTIEIKGWVLKSLAMNQGDLSLVLPVDYRPAVNVVVPVASFSLLTGPGWQVYISSGGGIYIYENGGITDGNPISIDSFSLDGVSFQQ